MKYIVTMTAALFAMTSVAEARVCTAERIGAKYIQHDPAAAGPISMLVFIPLLALSPAALADPVAPGTKGNYVCHVAVIGSNAATWQNRREK